MTHQQDRAAWRAQRRVGWHPTHISWWTGVLFMIGAFLFALGSVPGYQSAVPESVAGLTFFVGSLFFTSAAFLALLQSVGRLDISASGVQFAGTLYFNLSTFDAMKTYWDAHQQNLAIWSPDVLGSICFLVASWLAVMVVCKKPWCVLRDRSLWWINMVNLLGSVFFMISAIAAFVVPSTSELLNASMANSGTFLGALCFLWAARLSITSD